MPNSVPAMLGLAQLALEENNTDSALSWLDKAALADPNDLRPSIAKVDLLLAEGRTEPALAAARELQTRAPNSPIALASPCPNPTRLRRPSQRNRHLSPPRLRSPRLR